MISITATHITLTRYAMLRCHPAAYLSSCFIIHQSFAMRINNITSIWFALYLLRWTLVQSSTYDTLLELVDQQVHHGKSTDESRLIPRLILLLWFQLSVFDFCFLHSIWSCQCSGAVANHQNLDSDFRFLAGGNFIPRIISRKSRWFEPLFLKVF